MFNQLKCLEVQVHMVLIHVTGTVFAQQVLSVAHVEL